MNCGPPFLSPTAHHKPWVHVFSLCIQVTGKKLIHLIHSPSAHEMSHVPASMLMVHRDRQTEMQFRRSAAQCLGEYLLAVRHRRALRAAGSGVLHDPVTASVCVVNERRPADARSSTKAAPSTIRVCCAYRACAWPARRGWSTERNRRVAWSQTTHRGPPRRQPHLPRRAHLLR